MLEQHYHFTSNTRKHAISYHGKTFNPKEDNFKDTSLTHSRFHNCIFPEIDFEKAAVTGSLFESCTFIRCNFNNADLEFCDFIGCEFVIDIIDGVSFNNSNFIQTVISGKKLINCTFTGAFLNQSTFKEIGLEFSTLEGACFQNCTFANIDWRMLNLEYVEMINPKVENSVFPFHQIPVMFGMLRYLVTTEDDVHVSAGNDTDDALDKKEYLENGIAFLIEEYKKQKNYFPLCNIYLFGPNTDYNKAFYYLSQEITDLAALRDFRRIKFCCKLISDSQIFDRHKLNKLYEIITGIDQSMDENSPEMKSFTRNIGEIRRILYRKKRTSQMSVRLRANIGIEYSMRFANLVHQLQHIAKPNHSEKVYTTIQLSNNSPLIIDIAVEGDKFLFVPILYNLFLLSGLSDAKVLSLMPEYQDIVKLPIDACRQYSLNETIGQASCALKRDGIELNVLEYTVGSCFWTAKQDHYDSILQNMLPE